MQIRTSEPIGTVLARGRWRRNGEEGTHLLSRLPPRTGQAPLATFRVGRGNTTAYRAALALSRGEIAPPVAYFEGPSGAGKTHLLTGIARERERGAVGAVFFASAERWARIDRWARGRGRLGDLEAACRRLGMVLLDGVEALAGRPAAQRGLSHLLDRFRTGGRPLAVLSGRLPPYRLPLAEALQDRLASGLVLKLEPPDAPAPSRTA